MDNQCNCKQCEELRIYDRIVTYYQNPANLLSLTPQEVEMHFRISTVRDNSLAGYLINRYLVVCNDGFIRRR